MEVVGAEGKSLRDLWGDDEPRAYLGICVPGFPNFFITYGPNTNLAHGGSIIFQAECQGHYIVKSLEMLMEADAAAIDCTLVAHDAYNERLDEVLSRMVWTNEGVTNWYQNKRGRITKKCRNNPTNPICSSACGSWSTSSTVMPTAISCVRPTARKRRV
jgi:4-hydroxyacetophenone monooxygenase